MSAYTYVCICLCSRVCEQAGAVSLPRRKTIYVVKHFELSSQQMAFRPSLPEFTGMATRYPPCPGAKLWGVSMSLAPVGSTPAKAEEVQVGSGRPERSLYVVKSGQRNRPDSLAMGLQGSILTR